MKLGGTKDKITIKVSCMLYVESFDLFYCSVFDGFFLSSYDKLICNHVIQVFVLLRFIIHNYFLVKYT
jgi:hypothetical protein